MFTEQDVKDFLFTCLEDIERCLQGEKLKLKVRGKVEEKRNTILAEITIFGDFLREKVKIGNINPFSDDEFEVYWYLPRPDESGAFYDIWGKKKYVSKLVAWPTHPEYKWRFIYPEFLKELAERAREWHSELGELNSPLDLENHEVLPWVLFWPARRWCHFLKYLKNFAEGRVDDKGRKITAERIQRELILLKSYINQPLLGNSFKAMAFLVEEEKLKNENFLLLAEKRREVNYLKNLREKGMKRWPHFSHKRKICPLHTPESKKIGLQLYLSAGARVDFKTGKVEEGDNLLSLSLNLVPYAFFSDGPRVMMGGKNAKQAVRVKESERPLVAGIGETPSFVEKIEGGELYPELKDMIRECEGVGKRLFDHGVNAIVAVMPWEGYTFEDGLVISESLAKKLYVEEEIEDTFYLKSIEGFNLTCSPRLFELQAESELKKQIKSSIEEKGKETFNLNDEIPLPEGLEVYELSLLENEKGELERDSKRKLPRYRYRFPGRLKDLEVRVFSTPPAREGSSPKDVFCELTLKFLINRPLRVGDKLTGRHGNKGVVSKILPDKEMPRVKIGGKEYTVDLIISPCSIIGRKNFGQLIEMAHGIIIRAYLDGLLGEKEVMELKDGQNVKNWQEKMLPLLQKLGADEWGRFIVVLPDGTERRIYAGIQYILRLRHHASEKLQIRGRRGKRDFIFEQPLRGGPHGAQCFGEMENWSLLSHVTARGGGKYPEMLLSFLREKHGKFDIARDVLDGLLSLFAIKVERDSLSCCWSFKPVERSDDEITVFEVECKDKWSKSIKNVGVKRDFERFVERLEKINPYESAGRLSDLIWRIERIEGISANGKKPKIGKSFRKGIMELIKGKRGLLRGRLLKGRLIFSGRAVIVPEPSLGMDEILIPLDMARELFPDIRRKIRVIERELQLEGNDDREAFLDRLNGFLAMDEHYVIFIRQPSLHRHNVQAFRIKCWEESVIGIPPFICAGYNADFDGDTMAVFAIPKEFRAMARSLTPLNSASRVGNGRLSFSSNLDLALGWFFMPDRRKKFWLDKAGLSLDQEHTLAQVIEGLIRKNRGHLLRDLQEEVGEFSTASATLSPWEVWNLISDDERSELKKKMDVILSEKPFDLKKLKQLYAEAEEKIAKAIDANPELGVSKLLRSKAKGKVGDLRILAVSIGEVGDYYRALKIWKGSDDQTQAIVKSCFLEGLSEEEFFKYAFGSRRAMSDKKLSVAEAGYFSRRLAEGLYDLVVLSGDCGAKEGITYYLEDGKLTFEVNGLKEVVPPSNKLSEAIRRAFLGRVLVGNGKPISLNDLPEIEERLKSGERLKIRSPLTCNLRGKGVCSLCYGADPGKLLHEEPPLVELYSAVGLLSAQAIGERGTQLAMKTFHEVGKEAVQIEDFVALLVDNKEGLSPLERFARVLRNLEKVTDLDQLLIHFELASTPPTSLDAWASEWKGRVLSALAYEDPWRVIDGILKDGGAEDNFVSLKSSLLGGFLNTWRERRRSSIETEGEEKWER